MVDRAAAARFLAFAIILAAGACTFTLPEVRMDEPDAAAPPAIDAGADADAAPPIPFCDRRNSDGGKHDFCIDFDDGVLGNGWTISPPFGTPADLFAELTDASVSPPYSALFGVHGPATALSADQVSAAGTVNIAKSATKVHLVFAMRIEQLTSGEAFNVLYLGAKTGNDLRCEVTRPDTTDLLTITTYPERSDAVSPGPPSVWRGAPHLGEWKQVKIDLKVTSPAHYTVTVDGAQAVDADLPGDWSGPSPGLALGMPYIAGHAHDKSVVIDDVALDLE